MMLHIPPVVSTKDQRSVLVSGSCWVMGWVLGSPPNMNALCWHEWAKWAYKQLNIHQLWLASNTSSHPLCPKASYIIQVTQHKHNHSTGLILKIRLLRACVCVCLRVCVCVWVCVFVLLCVPVCEHLCVHVVVCLGVCEAACVLACLRGFLCAFVMSCQF